MPAKPVWFQFLPSIIEELKTVSLPWIDRASIERIFRVRRRRANQLMRSLPGYRSGRAWIVERQALIQNLEAIAAGDDFRYEQRRRELLSDALERTLRESRARSVRIAPLRPGSSGFQGLDDAVEFRTGELVIRFASEKELLSRLYQLAQAISTDYAEFERRATAEY